MKAWLALAASLLGALLLAWFATKTPAARPDDAPPTVFSAERAMDDVRAIARAPHPTGSAENARVRAYLLARLAQLGLEIRIGGVQAAEFGAEGERLNGAAVENVIAILPGRDRAAPAVLVMSHYDSVPGSPGAADDAAGVAAALEIARVLRDDAPPARDVVFLFTDAEEIGLYGARAFFEKLPLAKRIGFVVNMEARGGGGRALMFETGDDNGQTIGLFARNAVRPSSNSLAVFVYEHMPNGTDFTHAREAGIQGLNFAFIGRPAQYHSPGSTPDALDRGSLQHMGDQVLAVSRAVAAAQTDASSTGQAARNAVVGASTCRATAMISPASSSPSQRPQGASARRPNTTTASTAAAALRPRPRRSGPPTRKPRPMARAGAAAHRRRLLPRGAAANTSSAAARDRSPSASS